MKAFEILGEKPLEREKEKKGKEGFEAVDKSQSVPSGRYGMVVFLDMTA